MEGIRRAGCHASGILSLHQTIGAQIALLHLPIGPILRDTKGTGEEACAASYAFVLIHHHNTVFDPFTDGARGTYGLTGRFTTVHTGEGYGPGDGVRIISPPDTHHPSPFYTRFSIVQTLAGDLACVTLNTFICLKIKTILFSVHFRLLYNRFAILCDVPPAAGSKNRKRPSCLPDLDQGLT